MSLDDVLRLRIEKEIDDLLDDPIFVEERVKNLLLLQGIEPTLETTLSHVAGYYFGVFTDHYHQVYTRLPNDEEYEAFHLIMKRRAGELRDAFLQSRIDV